MPSFLPSSRSKYPAFYRSSLWHRLIPLVGFMNECANSPRGVTGSGVLPALVLGSAYTVLAAARGLGRAGVPIICPSDSLGYLATSRWIGKRPRGLEHLAEFSNLEKYLERASIPGAVIIPSSDHWVRETVALPAHLRKRFPASSPPSEAIAILLNKSRLAMYLQEKCFSAPLTSALKSEADIATWPEELFAHSFLKPCDSQRFCARFGCKAFHVHSREEAERLYRKVIAEGIDTVLQEYIPGPASDHYFIDGFIDSGGTVRAMFARHRLRMYPLDFGDSTYLRSVALSDLGDLGERLCELLSSLRYRGIYSAEFKHDRRDGRFKLLEINTRVWWQAGVAIDCGVNVPVMAYRDALGYPVEPVNSYPVGVGWVAINRDKKACWSLYRRGELSLGSWLWSWLTSTKELFKWSDPFPMLCLTGVRVATLPRRVARIFAGSQPVSKAFL